MRILYFLIFILFLSNTNIAQTGKISGKVISSSSGQALQSASVTLIEKSKTVIADQNGNFSFSKLAPGTYSINCSNVSYSVKIVVEVLVKDIRDYSRYFCAPDLGEQCFESEDPNQWHFYRNRKNVD